MSQTSTNYVTALITSEQSALGAGVSAILSGLLLTFGGFGPALIPLIVYALILFNAALFVAPNPVYRQHVDRKLRKERRESLRSGFLEKLEDYRGWGPQDSTNSDQAVFLISRFKSNYDLMAHHLESLKEMSKDGGTALSPREVERLEDASLDYLRLVLGWINLQERIRRDPPDKLNQRIQKMVDQIEEAKAFESDSLEVESLRVALENLRQAYERQRQLPVKAQVLDSRLSSMFAAFEELYQRIISDPNQTLENSVEETLSRMNIEAEIQASTSKSQDLEEKMDRIRRLASRQSQ